MQPWLYCLTELTQPLPPTYTAKLWQAENLQHLPGICLLQELGVQFGNWRQRRKRWFWTGGHLEEIRPKKGGHSGWKEVVSSTKERCSWRVGQRVEVQEANKTNKQKKEEEERWEDTRDITQLFNILWGGSG